MADGSLTSTGTSFDLPFLAEAEAIVAAQRANRAAHVTGLWSAMSREPPKVEDVETVRQRIAPWLSTQAALSRTDALISVAISIGGNVVVTNLDALGREFDLSWSERKDIRAELAAGRTYEADLAGGWSKLPKHAVLTGVVAKRVAA